MTEFRVGPFTVVVEEGGYPVGVRFAFRKDELRMDQRDLPYLKAAVDLAVLEAEGALGRARKLEREMRRACERADDPAGVPLGK